MNDPELETLWDPRERAGAYTRALEERLQPLRRGGELPPLRLPERQAPRHPDSARTRPAIAWGVAVAAALLLVTLALWSRSRGVDEPAPYPELSQLSPVTLLEQLDAVPERADAWSVASLGELANCKDPRVQTGAALFDGAELHTGEGVTRLSAGAARVELHPHSTARYDEDVINLVAGRAWAELPARVDAKPWRLHVGGLEIHAVDARFVAAVESGAVELEVVSGSLRVAGGGEIRSASTGQTCRAELSPGPIELVGPIECEATAGLPAR